MERVCARFSRPTTECCDLLRCMASKSHASQTSSWLPPLENWDTGGQALPYGWEAATDKEGKTYFINHLNKTTTYEDPRKDYEDEPPQPRQIDLIRDPEMGFGFVAGSEKPVIVRFVTEGGPSVEKLLPGDQILMINGEDVKKAPRDHVIQLVRSCKDRVQLTVTQPPLDNQSERKSALLSAAKKQRLKNNPSRVRFAESVDINGSPSYSPSNFNSSESTTPFMPNVLKVFLENGQTKSFKYDSSTTVGDVLDSLHQKLGIKCPEHFSLVVEHVKSLRRNKLTILDPKETLSRIAARPGAQHLRCLYRVTFVPRDAYDLLRKDSMAFEYLYLQCCNDVIQERFAPELQFDVALRLAALHIQQHALTNNMAAKVSVKTIEKDCGLERFVPSSYVDSMKRKELRKILSHFLKLNSNLTAPGQKQLTALQAKLHYLKIISELPSYGAKCFSTNMKDTNMETVILISPRFGISQITGVRNSMPEALCDIEQVTSVRVSREDELSCRVELSLKDPDKENLVVSLEDRDAEELVLVLQGYYRLLTENPLAVTHIRDRNSVDQAPPYHSRHKVQPTNWNYATTNEEDEPRVTDRYVDLSVPPPYKPPPEGYKVPNGHLPGLDMDETGVYVNSRRQNILDSNMNKTNSVYENANDSSSGASPTPQSHAYPSHHAHPSPASPARQPPADTKKVHFNLATIHPHAHCGHAEERSHVCEARNEEVIRRVAELQQLVEDAENYLSDADGEVTDVESVRSDQYGRLKHSDSLLLLTQGQKMLPNNEVVESEERSGSDTDSQSTPTQSPAHRPAKPPQRPSSVLKPSGSSFGLHSPDNLPLTLQNREDDIKALIKQLEDNSGLPYTFAEGTLYLDPDIIDLTMIPPPITPDEDGAKVFPPQLSTPPTPFADRETLEKELKALEQDLGDLRSLTNPSWLDHDAIASYADSTTTGASDTEDSMSLSSLNTSMISNDSGFSRAVQGRSSNFTLAALRQLGIHLEEGEDIDSFIANLTIPPPPEGAVDLQAYAESRKMGSDCDFSAFIIPPPPSSDNKDNRSSDIIRRLYEAKEGISRVVGEDSSHSDAEGGEKDLEIGEVRVSSETMAKRAIVGKVASLQKRFEVPPKSAHASPPNSSASIDNRQLLLKLSKDKSSSPSDSSGYDSLRSNNSNVACELDAKLAQALEENDKMFKSFDTLKRKQMAIAAASGGSPDSDSSDKLPSVMSRVRTFNSGAPFSTASLQRPSTLQRQMTVPTSKSDAKDDDPPPPPPRTPVTRTGTLTSPKKSAPAPPSKIQRSISMSTGNLVKSASQGDIMTQSGSNTILKSPTKSTKSSASSEDLSQAKTSPGSPSKQSVASSNDSLTSSSSIVTVKSASLKSLETDEDPPELPPRNGTKAAMKPPLPRSSSQDNVKVALHNKGIRSPSPVRKALRSPSPDNNERPPSVPSRLRKPQLSPSSSPTNSIPGTHRPHTSGKLAAPSPPTIGKAPAASPTSPRGGSLSPLKSSPKATRKSPSEEQKPQLPAKTSQSPARRAPASPPATNGVRSPARTPGKTATVSRLPKPDTSNVALKNSLNQEVAPLQTSSPKMSPKAKMVNGKTPTSTDLDDSLDSGSFDQDSLEEAEDVEVMTPPSREAFRRLSLLVSSSLKTLTEMAAACTEAQRSGGTATQDETKFQEARDALTSESRQFVTASKLFVKSATESEETLLQCLSNCMTLLQRMVDMTRQVVHHTTTPLQTQNVVVKVRDVATTYQSTVRAALAAAGRGMDHPSMNTLMTQATNLAGVLTALMRTLRVFSP